MLAKTTPSRGKTVADRNSSYVHFIVRWLVDDVLLRGDEKRNPRNNVTARAQKRSSYR